MPHRLAFLQGALVCVLAAALVAGGGAAADAGTSWSTLLVPHPLTLTGAPGLRDLGIVDLDGDGVPDLYTTNHNGRQNLALGDGHLGFQDVVSAVGLDQDPSLPGADGFGSPASTAPGGVYLYLVRGPESAGIQVVASVTSDVPAVDATVTVYGSVSVSGDPAVAVQTAATADGAGRPQTAVHLSATSSGTVTLLPDVVGTVVHVDVSAPSDTTEISLGPVAVHPAAVGFDWQFHDRHSVAWSDVDGDGDLDAFIARGGLKGTGATTFPGLVSDELFRNDGGHLTDVTADSGIVKNDCRGRRAVWVDVDGDGDLDLEVTCEGGPPQLWIHDSGFRFHDGSSLLPGATDPETFAWVDLDGDHRPELVAADTKGVGVYRAGADGAFAATASFRSRAAPFSDVALGDLDGNGRPDLLFVSPLGSLLLSGVDDGTLHPSAPTALGLPKKAENIAFVDVDRDGLTDLYAQPGGVYRQKPNHTFAPTGLLDAPVDPNSPPDGASVWFDGDGDGDPDAVVAKLTGGTNEAPVWTVQMYANQAKPAHWLALDLVGPVGNRAAVGATVTVVAGGVTTHHWVGEAETSRSSQGQYRIDVSLGRSTSKITSLTVSWPDGTATTLRRVAVDRLLTVSR